MVEPEGMLANDTDLGESRVEWIEEKIRLERDDGRGNDENGAATLRGPRITVATTLATERIVQPLLGHVPTVLDEFVGNVELISHQAFRQVVGLDMDEDLEDRERQMRGPIDEGDAR